MSNILRKGDETITVKDRYLNKFLEQGWTQVSDTSPKKFSKNVIKASAEVVEQEVPSNPPNEDKGD